MLTLGDKQALFTTCLTTVLLPYGHLLAITSVPPLRMRLDYLRRCPGCLIGHAWSTHKSRLAVDILLDEYQGPGKGWLWVEGNHRFYERLGALWTIYGEKHNIPTRWGGDFGDYGHFSFEHNGIK